MDPWPVTRGEYQAALDAGPLVSSHPACEGRSPGEGPRSGEAFDSGAFGSFCSIDTRFDEDTGRTDRIDNRMPWPPGQADLLEPMVCVSWCDAHAFCERVGKRLCGNRRMTASDSYDPAWIENAETDEYFNACSGGGTRPSPTGVALPSLELNTNTRNGFLPLQRMQLAAAGAGAWQGLYGLRVAGEYFGPVYLSVWSDHRGYEGFAPYRECRAMAAGARELSLANPVDHHFGGMTTFRCCADAEPVP